MSIDKYDPIRLLGEGSFGKVYLMRDKVRRNFVCVKVIKIKNIPKKEREATKLEVDLLRRLHHPNIVRYLDSFLSKNNETLCICMEYCDGGDLASQVKAARKNLFSESKILHWFVQMALGLHYMHSNKVLHRDLKTQNVFLLGNGRLVLGDLGISKVLDGTMDFAQTCIGTPYYMSPEIFQNKPYSYKSDVWALGCVLYEMTTLNHAFDANSLNGLACKIVKGRYPPIHTKYTKHLREMIGQMLLINPQQRPDLDQILRKPFIRKHILNFFTDIASRPSASLGEGTMIVRAAAGGNNGNNHQLNNDSNVLGLQKQLQDLDMAKEVSEVLHPPAVHAPPPADPVEAKKLVKDQASALRREEDHKKMVEAALEKLRKEREIRSKERNNYVVASAANIGAVPANPVLRQKAAASAQNQGQPAKAAAFRQPQAGMGYGEPVKAQPNVREGGVGYGGGGVAAAPARRGQESSRETKDSDASSVASAASSVSNDRRRRATYSDKEDRDRKASEDRRREDLAAANAARERQAAEERDRRREDVRIEARNREEARQREDARLREEAAQKQRFDEMRTQAEAAARREAQRERERGRQRDEIEQLKKDKVELDRLAGERDRVREARRAEEKRKLEDARRDRATGADRMVDYAQEKLSQAQINDYPNYGRDRSSGSEDTELNARDRVLQRKLDKQAKEEAERVDALKRAEQENRRIREAAQHQKRSLYDHGGVGLAAPKYNKYDDEKPTGSGAAGTSAKESVGLEDVTQRLHDVRGRNSRFDDAPAKNNGQRRSSYEDSSQSEDDGDDDSGIFVKAVGEEAVNEEEEDLHRREEELQAELMYATNRCNELQRTLQETKSFIGNRASVPKAAMTPGIVGQNTILSVNSESEDEEDLEDYEESFAEEEEEEEKVEAKPAGRPPLAIHSTTPPKRRPGPGIEIKPSPYHNLQDPPTPSGRLSDRIDRLRQKCMEALGKDAFTEAYQFLKQFEEQSHSGVTEGRAGVYDDDAEEAKKSRMKGILGDGKAHYTSLIEQLIFMEETHSG